MSGSDAHDRDATTDPARIERQIEATRHQLTETLTALERKLSARQLTTDVIDAVRETVLGDGTGQQTMVDLIKRNPVPAALIGLGLSWMVFAAPPRRRSAAPTVDPAPAAPTRAGRLPQRAGAMLHDNPLAVGALGAAIGALIGAILPMSRRERAWIAETQAELADQARELGRDAITRAGDVARHAGRAAVEVVERELGTTPRPAAGNGHGDGSIH
jgi:hypothetical protein